MSSRIHIRTATIADADSLLTMIRRLARLNDAEATITAAQLREDGFGERPCFHALIADLDRQPVGYGLWYFAYNASYGTRVLHLQHLYVEDGYRRLGIGRRLVTAIAQKALEAECIGIVLAVTAGNDAAAHFYRTLGFEANDPADPRFFLDRDGAWLLSRTAAV